MHPTRVALCGKVSGRMRKEVLGMSEMKHNVIEILEKHFTMRLLCQWG